MSLFCLLKTEITASAVAEAVDRCLAVIIPSLYAMLIISGIISKSGMTELFFGISDFFGRIFGMNGNIFAVFVFSMFAGYPVGTKMLCEMSDNGIIDKKSAEIFSGLCYGAGPAFIFGCISGQLYGTHTAGKIILISNISANFLTAFVFSFFTVKSDFPGKKGEIRVSGLLGECIADGGRSMLNICLAVTAFSVIISFLKYLGVITFLGSIISLFGADIEVSESIVSALLDVTAAGTFPKNDFSLLPVLSSLVSFGGVCVIFQIKSIVSGRISLKPLIFTRIAVSSGIICKIIAPVMLKSEIINTSVQYTARGYRSCSSIPSAMLVIMTLMLLSEYKKQKSLQNSIG